MKNYVTVIFADEQYNYCTDVSDQTTEQSARNYFVGTVFNMGSYPVENMQKCINVKFNREE